MAAFEIMKLPPYQGYLKIKTAVDNDLKDKLYLQWIAFLPNMSKETYMKFEDFCDYCTGANLDTRSAAEIIAEAKEAERRLASGR